MGHPADQPDVRNGDQPDHRAGDDGPDQLGAGDRECRHVRVGRVRRQVQPRGHGGDPGAGQRRQDHGQGDAAVEDLRGDQRTADGDVVDRGHARPAAAGHQQPPLGGREVPPPGQQAARHRPHQLGRRLPAERRAGADRHLRQQPGDRAAAEGELAGAGPHGVVHFRPAAGGEPPQQVPADAGDRSADRQHDEPPLPGRVLHRRGEGGGRAAVRQVDHRVQHEHQQVAEQPGGDPRHDQQQPELHRQGELAVPGRVRLLHRAAPRRQPRPDERLRIPHPFRRPAPGLERSGHGVIVAPAPWARRSRHPVAGSRAVG